MISPFTPLMLLESQLQIICAPGIIRAIGTFQYVHPTFHFIILIKVKDSISKTIVKITQQKEIYCEEPIPAVVPERRCLSGVEGIAGSSGFGSAQPPEPREPVFNR
jgi:hypothetical protein